jgi:anthranilate phosphoribosyltransferase
MLNAGVALYAANVAPTMKDGVALAREAIGSGRRARSWSSSSSARRSWPRHERHPRQDRRGQA